MFYMLYGIALSIYTYTHSFNLHAYNPILCTKNLGKLFSVYSKDISNCGWDVDMRIFVYVIHKVLYIVQHKSTILQQNNCIIANNNKKNRGQYFWFFFRIGPGWTRQKKNCNKTHCVMDIHMQKRIIKSQLLCYSLKVIMKSKTNEQKKIQFFPIKIMSRILIDFHPMHITIFSLFFCCMVQWKIETTFRDTVL